MKSVKGHASIEVVPDENVTYGPIYGGLVTSVSNPFFFMWWFTVGMTFMHQGLKIAGLVGLIAFLVFHWMSDLSWYGFLYPSVSIRGLLS